MSDTKNTQWHGGKGSSRRTENTEAYESNWDRIFGNKEETKDETPVTEESQWDRHARHMEAIERARNESK